MTGHFLRATGLLLVLILAGCSSMGGIAPASSGSSGAGRQIDLVEDNLANLVFALDLPDNVQPTSAGISFSYDVNDKTAPAYLDTSLARGDAEAVMGALPPPDAGRSYHVFAPSDVAKERLRSLQTFARGMAKRPSPLVNIIPRLCASGAVDRARTTVTVRVVLPGRGAITPLIANETLAALEARSGTIPACS
jgi:hypothetical protein